MDCVNCQKTEVEIRMHKCPICFKPICEDCGHREYGRAFCSPRCAYQFFFSDDD
jgi:hypothetical protein